MPRTQKKLVVSGDHLEVYDFSRPIAYGFKALRKPKPKQPGREASTSNASLYATKRKVRRLFYCNTGRFADKNGRAFQSIFVTYTFGESVTDLNSANYQFKKFIKRLNYFVNGKEATLQYIAVPEFQKDIDFYGKSKPDGGSIHYHVVFFNLPFIKNIYDEMTKLWPHGYHWIETVQTENGMIRYLMKYLTKQKIDVRLFNRRRYFPSRGLFKPVTFRSEIAAGYVFYRFAKAVKPQYVSTYRFEEYDLIVEYAKYHIPGIYNFAANFGKRKL